jgi:hypothetical protein
VENWKVNTAKALDPMLSRFLSVSGLVLRAVWQFVDEGCLDRILLDFGQSSLVVAVNRDDDSVDFWVEASTDSKKLGWVEVSRLQPWKEHVGKPFGWGWVTVNQQGYCDGLLLGFGDIGPHMVLNVTASSIKIAAIDTVSPS